MCILYFPLIGQGPRELRKYTTTFRLLSCRTAIIGSTVMPGILILGYLIIDTLLEPSQSIHVARFSFAAYLDGNISL